VAEVTGKAPVPATLDAVLDVIAEAVAEKVAAKLHANGTEPTAPAGDPDADRWLTVAQVAERLHTSVRWVYDHAEQLGGKRLSHRCVRFSEARLRRWLERPR